MRTMSKPWRVFGANNLSEDYENRSAAYEAVRELNGYGHPATVYKLIGGTWVIYERIPADREA